MLDYINEALSYITYNFLFLTTPNFPQQWLKLWQFQNKTSEGIAEGEVRIPANPVSDGNDLISVNYHNLSLYSMCIYIFHITRPADPLCVATLLIGLNKLIT